jgi:GR25 family glycosyltransferase involved in LPS biosynthesis
MLIKMLRFDGIPSIDRTFVINLDPTSTRMQDFDTMMGRLNWPYERFEAVNGKKLVASLYNTEDPNSFSNHEYLRKYVSYSMMNPSEIGCLLSHVALWDRVATDPNLQRIAIFEDDARTQYNEVQLRDQITSLYGYLQENGISEPDLLYLGKALDDCAQYKKVVNNVYYSIRPLCFHAYIITKTGAQKLLKLAPYNMPIDTIPHRFANDPSFKIMVFHPSLFYQDILNYTSNLRSLARAVDNCNECAKEVVYVIDEYLISFSAIIAVGFITALILFLLWMFWWS